LAKSLLYSRSRSKALDRDEDHIMKHTGTILMILFIIDVMCFLGWTIFRIKTLGWIFIILIGVMLYLYMADWELI
jgi:hypothetical protein